MARIRSSSASQQVGRPGFRQFVRRAGRLAARRVFVNDPSEGILTGDPVGIIRQVVPASLTTSQGANKDLKFTSNSADGLAHNDRRVRYVVAGASTALSVVISGTGLDLTVNVATTAGSAADSTAAQILAAVNAAASAWGTAELAPGSTGAGKPGAMAYTNLAGGLSRVEQQWGNGTFGDPNPSISSSQRDTAREGRTKKVVNRGSNRSLRKR